MSGGSEREVMQGFGLAGVHAMLVYFYLRIPLCMLSNSAPAACILLSVAINRMGMTSKNCSRRPVALAFVLLIP